MPSEEDLDRLAVAYHVTKAELRYAEAFGASGTDSPMPATGRERMRARLDEALRVSERQYLELPRQLELLALDFEREMVAANVDAEFRRYARARLRDPELLEMYVGGHTDKLMTAEEQLADYEDLIDELRGRLKRRLALFRKRQRS